MTFLQFRRAIGRLAPASIFAPVLTPLAALVLAVVVAWGGGWSAAAQEIHFFRIGTGSTAGTYFPIGSLIAGVISNPPGSRSCEDGGSCGVPGLIAVAQTTSGSVQNVEGVADGSLESGLAQSDVIYWAYTGTGPFRNKKKLKTLRVVANLYPESIHLVVRKGAGIAKVGDLRGKRVSLDVRGSGTRVDALSLLAAYGLKQKDIKAVAMPPGRAATMLEDGKLDAFVFIGGYPAAGISDLASRDLIDLLPLTGPNAERLRKRVRFFATDVIPAGTYEGIGEIRTLSVNAQLVVSAAADEELIYGITKALWHPRNRAVLDSGHAKARLIRRETALAGVSIPLHPGAERYYREAGMLK